MPPGAQTVSADLTGCKHENTVTSFQSEKSFDIVFGNHKSD
jgi:hypothetical protein